MFILSTEEMTNIEKRTINESGISGEVLMENAGKSAADKTEKYLGDMFGKNVLVVCGKGNNGGDGYVIARHLQEKGAHVYVLMCVSRDEVRGDAKTMLEKLPRAVQFTNLERISGTHFDIAVDAIFGTGFKGEIDGVYERAINCINNSGGMVISVDIPSGVNGSTGEVAKVCVRADYTFTFCREKLGHRIYPGKRMCGKTIVCDIGIPEAAVMEEKPKINLFSKSDMDTELRPLSPMDHKGVNGRLLIIGGSTGMAGSVCLAARAAMRAGAGLCHVAIPKSIYPIVATKLTEAMTIPLEDDENGCISAHGADKLDDIINKADAVVIGCGMSVNDNTCAFMDRLIDKIKIPMLVDADGLNILARNIDFFYRFNGPVVLTPHAMEMSRLTGKSVENINNDRVGTAMKFAKDRRVTLVLKGNCTVTANGKSGYINTNGNPGMATGGSGDVLSGVIGAMMAGGMKPFKAAACGVYLHGRAGDYAAEQLSMRGMIASDIVEALPHCFTAALSGKGPSSLLEKKDTARESRNIKWLT